MTDTSQLATLRRCGRLDPHEPHRWTGVLLNANEQPYFRREDGEWRVARGQYRCPGYVVIEGGEGCAECQRPIAACGCYQRLIEERRKEWYS